MFVQCSVDSVDLQSSITRQLPTNGTNPSLSSVVDILRDKSDSDRLDAIISSLDSVNKIIECTYDHDSETGDFLTSPGNTPPPISWR
jgi:hypothetical protein